MSTCAYCDEPGVTMDGSLVPTCQTHRSDRYDPTEYLRGLVAAEKWNDDDTRDEHFAAIDAAFPTRSGSHETYADAMRMVGNRRSKGALVALVNWLLVRLDQKHAKLVEVADKKRDALELARVALWLAFDEVRQSPKYVERPGTFVGVKINEALEAIQSASSAHRNEPRSTKAEDDLGCAPFRNEMDEDGRDPR